MEPKPVAALTIDGATAPLLGSENVAPSADQTWLKLAQDAFAKSTNYFDNNFRKQWADSLRMFQSRHPQDSKYLSDQFKYRSKVFRPKSRSVMRKLEATAAMAFFSNPDVVTVDPTVPSSMEQAASSAVIKELLNYRLTKTIPWFLFVIGGIQDAGTVGLVASLNYWKYRTRTEKQSVEGFHPEMGYVQFEQDVEIPVEDKPCAELVPIEFIRFDPGASWTDVVNTSPYIVIQQPMYVRDVLQMMETKDRSGASWKRLDKQTILQAKIDNDNPLVQARNDNKENQFDQTSDVNEFDMVMVHLNIIKVDDKDYVYWTLKDTNLLTDPKSIEEVFLHGERPLVIGFCVLETHKPAPASVVMLGSGLQTEANEVANSRLDNVKFVLNKRWFVRRGSNVDAESMLRNVPGGITMVNDVERDVREVNWQDVTSSAYAEQDRINVDYDELVGNFAQSSVMTNRRLNETVGGMRMMAQGANVLTEYTIRVYVETFVEPTLRQLVKLEQFYETDEVILAIAAEKAQLFQKFGLSQVTDSLLKQELTLSVHVGMGATDPDTRFQRFMQAMMAYNGIAKEGSPDVNLRETRLELFGLAGFRDSERFFQKVDPRLVQAQQMMQQAEAQAKEIVDKAKLQLMQRERALDQREVKMDLELMEAQKQFSLDARRAQQEFVLEVQKQRMEMSLDEDKHRNSMMIEQDKAEQEARLAREKAHLEATLKVFASKLDAHLKTMMAEVERKIKAQKVRTLEKQAPGKWKVTEH